MIYFKSGFANQKKTLDNPSHLSGSPYLLLIFCTTPLRYLIAIEQEHSLGKLFEKVFVPVAVHEELLKGEDSHGSLSSTGRRV